jgi:hypothetical protein
MSNHVYPDELSGITPIRADCRHQVYGKNWGISWQFHFINVIKLKTLTKTKMTTLLFTSVDRFSLSTE